MRWLLFAVLMLTGLPVQAAAPPVPLDLAIQRGLARLQQGAANYLTHRQCFSCHHQTPAILAAVRARQLGLSVDPLAYRQQVEFTLDSFRKKTEQIRRGQAVPGNNTTAVYALFTLQAAAHAPDSITSALIDYLIVRQQSDGSWPALMPRLPSEGSTFTNVYLALRALDHYGPWDSSPERLERIERAKARAARWLHKSKPKDTEDRVHFLHALTLIGAAPRLRLEARRELIDAQQSDGGWTQIPQRPTDAYATSTVLLALRKAGVQPTDPVYRRGVAWLLRQQDAQGAWIVTSRSRPVQTFFDNGDPGGKHQFISFLATGWAVLALLEAKSLSGSFLPESTGLN